MSHQRISYIAFVALLLFAAGCGGGVSAKATNSTNTNAKIAEPKIPALPKPLVNVQMEPNITERVVIETSMGNIVIGLFGEDAPKTVANFLGYVDKSFYTNKIFHRVIPGFMIQGGGFSAELIKDTETDPSIELEIIPGFKHMPGTVSMARTQVTSSATAQFFICVAVTPQLNGGYAAFGRIEEGLDIVGDISIVQTETKEIETVTMSDVPLEPVLIKSVKRLK